MKFACRLQVPAVVSFAGIVFTAQSGRIQRMFTRLFSFYFVLFVLGTFTLAAELCLAETYVEVIDNEENSVLGTIAALGRTQIVVNVQGVTQTIPVEKLVKIRNLAPNPYEGVPSATAVQMPGQQSLTSALSGRGTAERRLAEELVKRLQSNEQAAQKTFPGSVVALELKDGSRLTASSFTVVNNQGICRLLEQQHDLSIPLHDISAVRLNVRSLSEIVNPPGDWLRLAVPNAEGDRLVVGNPGSFDVYAGILGDVSTETVSFTVDGDVLPVPRRRVFGLVLHGETAPAAVAPPLATVTLWTGTRGLISDFQLNSNDLKDSELAWQTTAGLTVTVPLNMVSTIDFGGQEIAYLTDFERIRSEFTLPFASEIKPEPLRLLQTFHESRTKTSREVILDGVVYERGITLLGTASVEYRLPKPFATLRGVIGIEDQFRPHASARLQILADSQNLGTWELRGDRGAQRINLNLPQNCRLITIIAEPLPQSGTSTVLTIGDPMLSE